MATMGLECVIIARGHNNCANPVVSCAKFDALTHCHYQVIRVPCIRGSYQVLPWQPLRIEVLVGYTFDLLSEAIFYLLRTFLMVAIVTLL